MISLLAGLSLYLTAMGPIDALSIEAELVNRFQVQPSQIEFSDRFYVLPQHDWLAKKFIPFSLEFFQENGVVASGEGMDCDNAAHLFKQLLSLSNTRGGRSHEGDVPCAVIKTTQLHPFGGAPGDRSAHALILLRTSKGWHVIEPQTGAITRLATYPNREAIEWAFF